MNNLLYQNNNFLVISSINPEIYFEIDYIMNNINDRDDYDNLIKESFEFANKNMYNCEF